MRPARLARALLVAGALLSSGREVYRAADLFWLVGTGADRVTPADARFGPLRPWLAGRTLVGYLSDRRPQPEQFQLAQYALAPTVLAPGTGADLVVVDAARTGSEPTLPWDEGGRHFVVVRDFGDGLLLLRRPP